MRAMNTWRGLQIHDSVQPSRLLANTQTDRSCAGCYMLFRSRPGLSTNVLLGCWYCVIGSVVPTFGNTVLSPASKRIMMIRPDPENAGLFDNEDKGTTIPQNVPSQSAAPKKTSRPIYHSLPFACPYSKELNLASFEESPEL